MTGFASLEESVAFTCVLSFSPIVLSQYLLKPFLNPLILFSGESFCCCLPCGLYFEREQRCQPYSCTFSVQSIPLLSFNSTATL